MSSVHSATTRRVAAAVAAAVTAIHAPSARGDVSAAPAGQVGTSSRLPAGSPTGLVVVALDGFTDAAWPLAQSIYGTAALRPASVDDARARVLCRDALPNGAAQELRELADVVAAVRGEDAASRALLASLARRLSARAIVVVGFDPARPRARVFLPDAGEFDAATYVTDDPIPYGNVSPPDAGRASWSGALRSLARMFDAEASAALARAAPGPVRAPALATHARIAPAEAGDGSAVPGASAGGRAFYESGWFWAALGAAAFAGGTVFLATRDNGASRIHLEVKVPP